MLSDEYYLDFFRALESDQPLNGVSYLEELQVSFNNTLEIYDQELKHKIHLAFRLKFLKDSATLKFLDESVSIFISAQLLNAQSDIIRDYSQLKDQQIALNEKIRRQAPEAFSFVQELQSIAKCVSLPAKYKLYSSMIDSGTLEALCENWKNSDWENFRMFLCELFKDILNDYPVKMK